MAETPTRFLEIVSDEFPTLQNADLGEVKQRLAREARAIGATVLMNFRYGQKKHQWWELVFTLKWDTESWQGDGDAVKL